jgi:NRAMP (natural resistance-associated macrophage protein)-like metal ion transporter
MLHCPEALRHHRCLELNLQNHPSMLACLPGCGAVMLSRWVCYPLWVMAEIAIAACDLAEVIGAAVALQLLFGLPLWAGVLITLADVALVMIMEGRGFR